MATKVDFSKWVFNRLAQFVEFDYSQIGLPLNPSNVQDAILETKKNFFHSGLEVIEEDKTVLDNHQAVNFTVLTIDANLTLDGDIWLA